MQDESGISYRVGKPDIACKHASISKGSRNQLMLPRPKLAHSVNNTIASGCKPKHQVICESVLISIVLMYGRLNY